MLEHSTRTTALLDQLRTFFADHLEPKEAERRAWHHDPATAWTPWPGLETLKAEARTQDLWNLFLPEEYGDWSPGLTNLEYAPLAEQMGRVGWSSEVFNCAAPDTGNMEVLAKFGDERQKEEWLRVEDHGTELEAAFAS